MSPSDDPKKPFDLWGVMDALSKYYPAGSTITPAPATPALTETRLTLEEKPVIPPDYTQQIAREFKPLRDRSAYGHYRGIEPVSAVYLYDQESGKGQIIGGSNMDHPVTPASTIKTLTLGLTAQYMREHNLTLNDTIEVPKGALDLEVDLNKENHSDHHVLSKKMKLKDLIALSAMHSNNQATHALALFITGQSTDVTPYVNLANYTVRETIGAKQTLITNPTGLPHLLGDKIRRDVVLHNEQGKVMDNLQQITAGDAVHIYHWAFQQMPDDMRALVNSESHRVETGKNAPYSIKPRNTFYKFWPQGGLAGNTEDIPMQVTQGYNKTGMIGEPNHRIYSRVAIRNIEVDGHSQQLVVFVGGQSNSDSDTAKKARENEVRRLMREAMPTLIADARARRQEQQLAALPAPAEGIMPGAAPVCDVPPDPNVLRALTEAQCYDTSPPPAAPTATSASKNTSGPQQNPPR